MLSYRKPNKDTSSEVQWLDDCTFCFSKGTRPLWTKEAKDIVLEENQDRRHGLHGAEIITKAVEEFINNELKKSGREKTFKKLYVNLKCRSISLKSFEEEMLDDMISKFRKHAFSKVSNLLPGDSDYNRAIEAIRKRMVNLKKELYIKFFSQGEMPEEIKIEEYKNYILASIKPTSSKDQSKRKQIINQTINNIIIPGVNICKHIREVDEIILKIIDTTKIDIGFADTSFFKRFNKRVLDLDARIKRGIISNEGLTQEVFNKLIGYKPRKKTKK